MIIRYITGRGGSGTGGLSSYLRTLAESFDVLPIDPDFLRQDIQGQIDSTRAFVNLKSGNIIANSYGAYLLLLSLIDQPPLPVRTLLLSPVLGRAISEERMLFSRPPRERTLHQAISEQRLGMPDHLEIVTGAEDEICDPALARQIGEQMEIPVSILPNEGHMLAPSSVERALNRFLSVRENNL